MSKTSDFCDWCDERLADICRQCWDEYEESHNNCVDEAFDCGAAAAFGLMGMAMAVKEGWTCEDCGAWEPPRGPFCHCWDDE
jgi:hypothetical protein